MPDDETGSDTPVYSFNGQLVTCVACGRPLGDSGDDQPDWPGGPLCGDCYQARQMDDEIWWSEADDT